MPRGFPELVEKARATDKLETQLFQLKIFLEAILRYKLESPQGISHAPHLGAGGYFHSENKH